LKTQFESGSAKALGNGFAAGGVFTSPIADIHGCHRHRQRTAYTSVCKVQDHIQLSVDRDEREWKSGGRIETENTRQPQCFRDSAFDGLGQVDYREGLRPVPSSADLLTSLPSEEIPRVGVCRVTGAVQSAAKPNRVGQNALKRGKMDFVVGMGVHIKFFIDVADESTKTKTYPMYYPSSTIVR
jgi:hypothetical protein